VTDLIAIGELMLDLRAPPLVPGASIHAPLELRAGGSPVNAALAAAAEGARALVIGRIGRDPAGRLVRDSLRSAGVEALLAEDPLLATGTFLEAGDAVVAHRGANAALAPADLPALLEARALLVSAYAPPAVAEAAVARAVAEWVAGPGGNAFIGDEPPAEPYRLVCVTHGPDGATATLDGVTEHRPAPGRVEGRATGAGDAFAAGLLLGLVRGLTLGDALELGCRLGFSAARTRSRAGTASAGS
jgi:sugar/nucleoside kinase (ribokinase family)